MKTLIKVVLFCAVLLWILGLAFDNTIKYVEASELDFQFGNPAFSGNGYSQHVLTIENQEFSRKQAIKEKKEAA